MALVSKTPFSSIFSFKNLVFSLSVVFVALIFKLCVPIVSELVVSGVPLLWTTLISLFTPPYLYVVVNIIIIAIAASSRFQQRLEDAASEVLPPIKVQADLYKESYEVGRKNSVEYKMDFEKTEPQMNKQSEGNKKLEVKPMKKPNDLEVKTRKKLVETNNMYGYMKAEDVEVKIKKKPMESNSRFEATGYYSHMETFEVKTKKKQVEPKLSNKYGRVEDENLEFKKNKVETAAKEEEDEFAHSKSLGTPNRTNTVEIPVVYSFSSKEKGLNSSSSRFDHQEPDEEGLQAGKEVRATEADAEAEEENDTLDDTWKMIMEARNAGLQGASKKVDKSKKSNNLRSPSQSSTRRT